MRKDVKIIMAVCVIVLVGLIVYALFLPGEKKSPVAATENAADNTTASNTPAENSAEAPATQPAETNITAIEPTTQPGGTAMAGAPTAAPSATAMSGNAAVTAGPAAASGDWNKLLETGSATPDATSSMSSGAVAPSSVGMSVGIGAAGAAGAGTTGTMAMSSTPMPESAAGSSSGNGMATTPNTATGQRTYIVKSGDTPSSIAQAEYGNRQLYTKILAANPKLNARHMHVGQKIILPDLSAASSKNEKTRVSSAVVEDTNAGPAESASGSSANSATPAEPGSRYTVVSGDSLQRIAAKVYGNSAQWQKIYDLNKSKIGSNPAHLRVGMVLMLPKARTKTAASATETPAATPAASADTTAAPMNVQPSEAIPVSGNGAAR